MSPRTSAERPATRRRRRERSAARETGAEKQCSSSARLGVSPSARLLVGPYHRGGLRPPLATVFTGELTPPARHRIHRGAYAPRSPPYSPGGLRPPLATIIHRGLM